MAQLLLSFYYGFAAGFLALLQLWSFLTTQTNKLQILKNSTSLFTAKDVSLYSINSTFL
jgi:hypothetical protein